MGDLGQPRQGQQVFRPLVAFDFDGTLTHKDSFLAFLAWRAGARRYATGLIKLAPAAAAYAVNRDRGRIKARAVREFLSGTPLARLEEDASRYATHVARSLLRPDAVGCWRRWQAQGARLVIVTASPEQVVAPFARSLGADTLIGSRLALDTKGRITGELDGANCRGEEKVRRLREVFGPEVQLEAAYGDTDGDKEMLELAEEKGMKVFSGTARK